MKSRRQDLPTITGRITRSKTLLTRGESSLPIPIDLFFNILWRLPAKSIAKCRCVSKFWAAILRLPYFTELFLTRSSARPQLLFTCRDRGELFRFALPHFQNSDENSSLVVAANHLTRFSFEHDYSAICSGPVHGLVCRTYPGTAKGRKEVLVVICNPSTGQILKLPKAKTRVDLVRSFLGYDPIGKQVKVLYMTRLYEIDDESMEYQVLTLGTKKLSWRKVECSIPHYPGPSGICINGSLYYGVEGPNDAVMIICFDVRSEKFRFINRAEDMNIASDSTLVDYNGKLAALLPEKDGVDLDLFTRESRCIELWALEDPERHEWSKHIHVLPPLWENVVGDSSVFIVGMIGMNEIVLASEDLSDLGLFYVYHYNTKNKTIIRVEIQGLEDFRHATPINTFLNHVENVELMQDLIA